MEKFMTSSFRKFFLLLVGVFLLSSIGFAQFTVTPGNINPAPITQSNSPGDYVVISKEAASVELTVSTAVTKWTVTIEPKFHATISSETTITYHGNETFVVDVEKNMDADLNVIELVITDDNNPSNKKVYRIIQDGEAPYITKI